VKGLPKHSKGPNGGFGPFEKCDVERFEEEKKTARAERSPLHIAKLETWLSRPFVISFTRIKRVVC
jgi:hypothetical protein